MDEGMMFVQPVEILQKLLRGRMCGAANRSMHIDANGKVSPRIFGPTFLLGKSTKMEPLEIFGKGKLVINFKLFVRFVSLVNAIVAVVFVKTNVQLVASISGATMINRILTAFMR